VPPGQADTAIRYPAAFEEGQVIRVGRHGEWAFVIDEFLQANTLGMAGHDVASRLPDDGEGALVQWTPNTDCLVHYWSGETTASFDTDLDDPGTVPGRGRAGR
jgi:hypothetical protein